MVQRQGWHVKGRMNNTKHCPHSEVIQALHRHNLQRDEYGVEHAAAFDGVPTTRARKPQNWSSSMVEYYVETFNLKVRSYRTEV